MGEFDSYHSILLEFMYSNSQNAYWNRCAGPEDRKGLTFKEMIEHFESVNVPMIDEILNSVLANGLKRGIYKQLLINITTANPNIVCASAVLAIGTSPEDYFYFANNAMIIDNYTNKKFQPIAPNRICNPCGC
jgi:hypothetical protein